MNMQILNRLARGAGLLSLAALPVVVAFNAVLGVGAAVLFWLGSAAAEGRLSTSAKVLPG